MIKRYLVVVGVILATLLGLAMVLKPPLEDMRRGVAEGLRAYARATSGEGSPSPDVTSEASRDWIVAVSHEAKVGDLSFSCWGAFRVTVCVTPDS